MSSLRVVSCFFTIIIFNCVFLHRTWAQQDSLTQLQFEKIILSENRIQGLQYQLDVNLPNKSFDLSGLGMKKIQGSPSVWSTDTLYTFSMVKEVRDSISTLYNLEVNLHYYLFDKKVALSAAKAYVESIIRNQIFIPSGIAEESDANEGQLIVKGAKLPYKPFYKLKAKILNEIKMVLLLSILLLFLVSSFILVIAMWFIKIKKNKKEILSKRFKQLSYGPISTLLFEYDLDQLKEFSKSDLEAFFPKKYLSKNLFKDVMIQEIISLNKNMKGDFKDKLKLIYRTLELDKFSLNKLKQKRWDIVTMGIVEANEMDVIEAVPLIEKYVSHSNFYIRSHAISSLLNLSNDKNLMVLAQQKYLLSKWQQMIYLRIIKFLTIRDTVKIIFLLESENESVRIFGIKLVRYLGRLDRILKLSEMFPSAGNAEKVEILKSYNALNAVHHIEQVHDALFSEDPYVSLCAIKTLENLGNDHSQALLMEKLRGLMDFEFKKAILTSLYTLNKTAFYDIIAGDRDEEVDKICLHLEDPVLTHV